MNGKLPFTLLCVAALTFACGPRQRNEASTGTRATAARVASESDLPLAPMFAVDVNEDVRFEFQVVNASDKKLEVKFANGRTHDWVVFDSLGNEVWRWSDGRLFTQAMQNKVLRTDDSLRYDGSWSDAPPGRYVAVATLSSANFPIERRVEFEVR